MFVTLTSIPPILKDKKTIEIKISNDAQYKLLEENKLEMMEYLRKQLKNDIIEVSIVISEEVKNNNIPYTPKDKFNKMAEDNPSLKYYNKN